MPAMNREALTQLWNSTRYWINFVGVRRMVSALVSALMAAVVLWLVLRPSQPPLEASIPMATFPVVTTVSAPMYLTVHVAGAVVSPGVYKLVSTARVIDAVTAAGGPTTVADLERINLAQLLLDTEQVFIPMRSPRSSPLTVAPRHRPTTTLVTPRESVQGDTPQGRKVLIDLNSATAAQLDALPGVGPATSKAIIDYRTSKGKFTRVEDLLNVAGIGPAKLAALRDLVTVLQ